MTTDLVLVKLDSARQALAEAKTIQDTKRVYDAAAATLIFAKRQKAGREIELQVTAFMLDALKQLGDMLKETAKLETRQVRGGNRKSKSQNGTLISPTLAELGLDKKTSALAQQVAELTPAEIEKVKQGSARIKSIVAKHNKEKRAATPELPSDKYRVIYADPPWKYSSGEQHSDKSQDTVLSTHYPSMGLDAICELPIKPMADDNSVLFLWTTSPCLEEAFEVIAAWGFKYKASFVWDKIKHNVGHYNSVRHEFLLLCTRGSCLPDAPELIDSVQSIERGEHSVKPKEFRDIIDKLYPFGKRIELFAREKTENWDTWGNE